MNVSILEITEIPSSIDVQSKLLRTSGIKSLLEQFSLLRQHYSGEMMLELGMMAEKSHGQVMDAELRVFCIFRYSNECSDIIRLVKQFKNTFCSWGYRVELLLQDETDRIEAKIRNHIKNDTKCLVKHEHVDNIGVNQVVYNIGVLKNITDDVSFINKVANVLTLLPGTYFSVQFFSTELSSLELQSISVVINSFKNGLYTLNSGYINDLSDSLPELYENINRAGNVFSYNIIVSTEGGVSNPALQIGNIISENSDVYIEVLDFNERTQVGSHENFYWLMNNTLIAKYRNFNIWDSGYISRNLFRLPYIISSAEAAFLFDLPINDGSSIGMNVNYVRRKNILIPSLAEEVSLYFGDYGSMEDKVSVRCPLDELKTHMAITGMPGYGKTTFAIDLLLQLANRNIPFIVLEPSKTEYRALIDAIPNINIFTPGNSAIVPFLMNPFLPPQGVSLEVYKPSLLNAFQASFSMPEPLDVVFRKTISRAYIKYGWSDNSTSDDYDVKIFGMIEFIQVFKEVVKEFNYDEKYKGTLQTAGVLRLMDLIEQNGNVFDSVKSVSIEEIINTPTIIELNAIDNKETKALLIVLLLIKVSAFIRSNRQSSGDLKNVFMIDEAHVLLDSNGQAKSEDVARIATGLISDMVAEFRSYGMGLIIADQKPSVISNRILSNVGVKVSFRLGDDNEKDQLKKNTNMSDEDANQLNYLNKGEAYIYYSKLSEPLLVNTRDVRAKMNIRLGVSNDEIASRCIYWEKYHKELIPYDECRYCAQCSYSCNNKIKTSSEYYAKYLFEKYKRHIKDNKTLKLYMLKLHTVIIKNEISSKKRTPEIKKLVNCAKIKFFRKCVSELDLHMTNKEIATLMNLTLLKEGQKRG